MYLQKVISKKLQFFVGILKVYDENSRPRSQIKISTHLTAAVPECRFGRVEDGRNLVRRVVRTLLKYIKMFLGLTIVDEI
jgi:hypothetical protein